nr:MAG TPA: hypothetical protein [Caudoviricetes sp.]
MVSEIVLLPSDQIWWLPRILTRSKPRSDSSFPISLDFISLSLI